MRKIIYNENYRQKLFDKGIESHIYTYEDLDNYDDIVLLKKFVDINKRMEKIEKDRILQGDFDVTCGLNTMELFLESKRNKIHLLSERQSLKNEVTIYDELVDKDDNFIGYTMAKSDYKPIDNFERRKYKLIFLKLIREKIRRLNEDNIYIGDFNVKNFLVSPNKDDIKLCDIDNFKIDGYDFNIRSQEALIFKNGCSMENKIDSFCFNIFTLSLLLNKDMPYVAYYLKELKIPRFISNNENKDIIDSMIHLDDSYKPKYLIDNIK